jgi:hypothetical protein
MYIVNAFDPYLAMSAAELTLQILRQPDHLDMSKLSSPITNYQNARTSVLDAAHPLA